MKELENHDTDLEVMLSIDFSGSKCKYLNNLAIKPVNKFQIVDENSKLNHKKRLIIFPE